MPEDKRPAKSERAYKEEETLKFWKENDIFKKTLEKTSPQGEFVFYDGPPFATGLPHYGSLLSSIIKDVIPRYKTMQGFYVRRRWGWDCHGLPIENMVEKELGLKSKKEIEDIGVAKFNRACRESVLRFVHEWKKFVDRVGRFVDFDNSYKTMDNTYIESMWWSLKQIYEKGLLYEGRKVLLYCPHCETPLAKAEIAMDNTYKDITEESVYIKFKIKGFPDAYFLAWTTTPWTLPGNVALAVGEDIDYVEAKVGKDIFVLAKEKLSLLTDPYEIVAEHKGKEMIGMQYEPLYEFVENNSNAFKIYPAEFVNVEDGTGIVHTAVMYGEDDYELGLKYNLPMVPMLNSAAHFDSNTPEFIRGQYFKKAEKAIKEDLEKRNLLFKREMYTHSYPHCHRCGTGLLYNALSSWFINIQKIKARMIELNEDVHWVPEHLKHGRFLNIIESAPDWTISRNRYWASPLPIWKDQDGKVIVIGSIEELKSRIKKNGNAYFVMRHGGTEGNKQELVSYKNESNDTLTEEGKMQVASAAEKLKDTGVDIIIASPFARTRETAEIVRDALGLPMSAVVFDERLIEVNPGEFDGKNWNEYHEYMYATGDDWYERQIPGGESLKEVGRRIGSALYDLEKTYAGKRILIVTHGGPAWLAYVVSGLYQPDHKQYKKADSHVFTNEFKRFGNAEVRELPFVPLPHDEDFKIDLHRPYIDNVELVSDEGLPLRRIPEVIDGWVESGSMPFAEYHYPFENREEFTKRSPADFIAEYIAQTRTWFYYMHVMGVLLFDKVTFRNVVTTGNILAVDGSKMSKSKGNFTDPMINLDLFGADSLRFYLMSSVVMQAEDTRFSDDEVRQIHNQFINTLWNTFKFYELYGSSLAKKDPYESKNMLDRWILSRLDQLTKSVTTAFEAYDTVGATRPMKEFVSDFSTWYIRRSRDRFKGEDEIDQAYAFATTRYVFLRLASLIAPVTPFIAEDIYQGVRDESDPVSVHLTLWPVARAFDDQVLKDMLEARRLVTLALEARSKANMKVRQPLQEVRINNDQLGEEYQEIIKEELNVKSVVIDTSISGGILLDVTLTPDLIEEGQVRELIRSIQEMRKEKGLEPKDVMEYVIAAEEASLFKKFGDTIRKITNISIVEL